MTAVTRISAGLYDVKVRPRRPAVRRNDGEHHLEQQLDVSPDVGGGADANTVRVGIVDPAGTFTDGYFTR